MQIHPITIDWTAATQNLYTTGTGRFDGGIAMGTTPGLRKIKIYGSSHLAVGLDIDNSETGDAVVRFIFSTVEKFALGVDNSDSDKFKIAASSALATDTVLTIDSSGNFDFHSGNFANVGTIAGGTYNTLSIIPTGNWISLSGDGTTGAGLDILIPISATNDFYYGDGGTEHHHFGNSGQVEISDDGIITALQYNGITLAVNDLVIDDATNNNSLTVSGDWTIDQDVSSGGNVTFGTIGCGAITSTEISAYQTGDGATFGGPSAYGLKVFGFDDKNTDYIQLSVDSGGRGAITTSNNFYLYVNGSLLLASDGTRLNIAGDKDFNFGTSTYKARIRLGLGQTDGGGTSADAMMIGVPDPSQGTDYSNNLILTEYNQVTDDFEYGQSATPTLYINTGPQPAARTQWIRFRHNETDGEIATGAGDIQLLPATGFVGIGGAPTVALDVTGDSLISGEIIGNPAGTGGKDFIFGSSQKDDTGVGTQDLRMFFDKTKGAFRAGGTPSTAWDAASVGNYSIGLGLSAAASGDNGAISLGLATISSGGEGSIAAGNAAVASGASSIALGYDTEASGTFGATAIGRKIVVSGTTSVGIQLDNTARTLAQNNSMAIMGGNVGIGTLTPQEKLAVGGNVVLPKTSGNGIKIDNATPTFGWADLLGNVTVKSTGGTRPTHTAYNGTIDAFQFGDGDETSVEYHIPHDYVPGTDIYLHIHWSQTSATCTGGTIDFKYFAVCAKGHNQASGSAYTSTPITDTFSSIDINDGNSGLTQYQHHITEVIISGASATAELFDRDDLEPDGVIKLTLEMDSNNLTDGVTVLDPFISFVDIHYQTTGLIGTKDKAPDFYT